VKNYLYSKLFEIVLVKQICLTNSSILDQSIYKPLVYLSIDNINIG